MAIDKVVNPGLAASLYSNIANIGDKSSGGSDDGVSFSDFLKSKLTDTVNTLKAGEKVSAQAITGKANLTDVVQALSSAEMTLQTIVAVRDRLVSAYQEIMRMPI
jgi:flagellar hook-basal body complex protein FliE